VVVRAGHLLGVTPLAQRVLRVEVDEVDGTTPCASPSAVSTESVSRRLTVGLTASRSTMTSIVCLYFLSSVGGSSSWMTSPSTRARLNPARQLAEQLDVLALATADHRASTWNRVPSAAPAPVDDLLRRLPADRLAADRAVRRPARANSSRR
jgi:hypothetical protein